VIAGGTYISPALAEELAQRLTAPERGASHEALSDREYQIMSALAAGKTVKEISFDLGLSVKTVSTYRTRLLSKLKLGTTAELIRYALREGLIE
jgi:DNA-binding NarL/FixJ family response regulator